MFCPECKSEYRTGYTHCEKCNVDLVDRLPTRELKANTKDAEFVTVFVTADGNEAALVVTLLEGSGLEASLFDDNLSRMDFPAAIILGGIKVAVPREQEELALEVLQEYRGKAGQDPTHGSLNPFSLTENEDVSGVGDMSSGDPVRCAHCFAPLEPEATVCSKCGRTPW